MLPTIEPSSALPSVDDVRRTVSFLRLRLDHVESSAVHLLSPSIPTDHRNGDLKRLRAAVADLFQVEELVTALEAAAVILNEASTAREAKAQVDARLAEAERKAAGEVSAAVQSLRIPIS